MLHTMPIQVGTHIRCLSKTTTLVIIGAVLEKTTYGVRLLQPNGVESDIKHQYFDLEVIK